MLEESLCRSPEVKPLVQRVVVPAHAWHYLPNGAVLPSTPDDSRRFVRRASNLQAKLEITDSWEPTPESERDFLVPVSNISRAGACFFHHTQLYPDDHLILDFGALKRHFHVTRCRRVGAECFEVGVEVLDA